MPVTSYWSSPEGDETTISVTFKDADFERTETINVVLGDDSTYSENLTSDAIQLRCVEIEQERAGEGVD